MKKTIKLILSLMFVLLVAGQASAISHGIHIPSHYYQIVDQPSKVKYDIIAKNPVLIPSSICGPGGQWTGCGPATFAGLLISQKRSLPVNQTVQEIMNQTNWNSQNGGGANMNNLINAISNIFSGGLNY
jgi:hypothetical protein